MDYQKVFETMVHETKKYMEDHNVWSMILGISGGLDSTVTAAICHEVEKLNPELKFYGMKRHNHLFCLLDIYEHKMSQLFLMKEVKKSEFLGRLK